MRFGFDGGMFGRRENVIFFHFSLSLSLSLCVSLSRSLCFCVCVRARVFLLCFMLHIINMSKTCLYKIQAENRVSIYLSIFIN